MGRHKNPQLPPPHQTSLPPSLNPLDTDHLASAAYRITLSQKYWTWSEGEMQEMAKAIVELDKERSALRVQLVRWCPSCGGASVVLPCNEVDYDTECRFFKCSKCPHRTAKPCGVCVEYRRGLSEAALKTVND